MSIKFDNALKFTLQNEGGYVYDPDDRGGKTNLGITESTLINAFNKGIVKHKDPKQLTVGEAADIYKSEYWNLCKAEQMPNPLAMIHFDSAVNHGVGGAGKLLQKAINSGSGIIVGVDGAVGKATLAALNNWLERDGVAVVCNNYCDRREELYRSLAAKDTTQSKFLKGWLNRNDKCRKKITEVQNA